MDLLSTKSSLPKKKENYCRESFRENYKRKKTQIYEG